MKQSKNAKNKKNSVNYKLQIEKDKFELTKSNDKLKSLQNDYPELTNLMLNDYTDILYRSFDGEGNEKIDHITDADKIKFLNLLIHFHINDDGGYGIIRDDNGVRFTRQKPNGDFYNGDGENYENILAASKEIIDAENKKIDNIKLNDIDLLFIRTFVDNCDDYIENYGIRSAYKLAIKNEKKWLLSK